MSRLSTGILPSAHGTSGPEAERIQSIRNTGAEITIEMSDGHPIEIGRQEALAVVRLCDPEIELAFWQGDPLRLAVGFVEGRILVEGDLREVMRAADSMSTDLDRWRRARAILRFLLSRRGDTRRLAKSHYDRPFDFFRPWLGRTRSYTHALFGDSATPLDEAQDQKLSRALEALDLGPQGRVLDVGCGWGSFLEFAGGQGRTVDGVTVSHEQAGFVRSVIDRDGLPCSVHEVDFFDFRAQEPYDGAVLMGSLEHLVDTRRVARRLRKMLRPGARVWADFCAQANDRFAGEFITRYVWPGPAMYVHLPTLIQDFERVGFRTAEISDDTDDYARTVELWCDRLETSMGELALEFGRDVRLFQLLLRGSQHFLETRQTLAYHVVLERGSD